MGSAKTLFAALAPVFMFALLGPVAATEPPAKAGAAKSPPEDKPAKIDRSGKVQKGEASFYGPAFYGKEMANGEPMKPNGNNAASKTLPLGTKAQVTNLENGKSDVVVVEDRGPYVDGRIIDVSPKTATRLGFRHDGVAPVKVKPLEVPKPEAAEKSAPATDAK